MIFYIVQLCCFFFFFKQKTAYEMRISDWSSDVCSSDLCGEWLVKLKPVTQEEIITHAHLFCGIGVGAKGFNKATPRVANIVGRYKCIGGIDEIGRASCRERGCPYV